MRSLVLFCGLIAASLAATAQTEMGDDRAPGTSWTLLSIHRVWVPQNNNRFNDGFGLSFFSTLDADRRWWAGGTLTTTGVGERDALALQAGMGLWLVGTGRLGAYMYLTTGLGMTSASGLTGFNFFTDPTLSFGLATQGGIGGCLEVYKNIRLHTNVIGMWFTNENGATPYGVQLGITFGGR
jgi:hypothetical protein